MGTKKKPEADPLELREQDYDDTHCSNCGRKAKTWYTLWGAMTEEQRAALGGYRATAYEIRWCKRCAVKLAPGLEQALGIAIPLVTVKEHAIRKLRELCPPGTTIRCILRHRSSSGMSRRISFYVVQGNEEFWLDPWIEDLGHYKRSKDHEGLIVGGCGMDMGFAVVYDVSGTLYPDGFYCLGEGKGKRPRCPANDHVNGDRNYKRHLHKEAGAYAIKHEWM